MLSLCCVCMGHPNIIKTCRGSSKHMLGVSKHMGCPNIQGAFLHAFLSCKVGFATSFNPNDIFNQLFDFQSSNHLAIYRASLALYMGPIYRFFKQSKTFHNFLIFNKYELYGALFALCSLVLISLIH